MQLVRPSLVPGQFIGSTEENRAPLDLLHEQGLSEILQIDLYFIWEGGWLLNIIKW